MWLVTKISQNTTHVFAVTAGYEIESDEMVVSLVLAHLAVTRSVGHPAHATTFNKDVPFKGNFTLKQQTTGIMID